MAKTKESPDDLLTMRQSAAVLGNRVQAQAIRIRVRKGQLPCYWQQSKPGIMFVKRGELMKLYEEKLYGWLGKEGRR